MLQGRNHINSTQITQLHNVILIQPCSCLIKNKKKGISCCLYLNQLPAFYVQLQSLFGETPYQQQPLLSLRVLQMTSKQKYYVSNSRYAHSTQSLLIPIQFFRFEQTRITKFSVPFRILMFSHMLFLITYKLPQHFICIKFMLGTGRSKKRLAPRVQYDIVLEFQKIPYFACFSLVNLRKATIPFLTRFLTLEGFPLQNLAGVAFYFWQTQQPHSFFQAGLYTAILEIKEFRWSCAGKLHQVFQFSFKDTWHFIFFFISLISSMALIKS
eukprot:TRINITY_DN92597_c0_g1_i1.p1 TRINITY_DN92597_c0_g1~~TRINITY_DN92597_c0_g1_i1.p1  ORF type:complete len:284 (+),score=-46.54 TRINITY_DN92597_c0_g1_i1:47-853(+)